MASQFPQPYYNFDTFIFSSRHQEKEIYKKLSYSKPFILIVSHGGLGGSHLLSACGHHYSCKCKIASVNVEVLIDDFKRTDFEIKEHLLTYDILFIDGFQRLWEEDFLFDKLQLFVKQFLSKGGRFVVKTNPTTGIHKFKEFISAFGYAEIVLSRTSKVVIKVLLKNFSNDFDFIPSIKQKVKRILVALSYASYREFQALIICITHFCIQHNCKLTKSLAIHVYHKLK